MAIDSHPHVHVISDRVVHRKREVKNTEKWKPKKPITQVQRSVPRRAAWWVFEVVFEILVFLLQPIGTALFWLHDHVMYRFLDQTYIYNVTWEDPRMDHRALNLSSKDHVITLSSAGDNVLDYLIEGASVLAVDLNKCQLALLEIKAVAIQNLSWEEFFAIFGKSDCDLLRKVYPGHLRPHLGQASREFWDHQLVGLRSLMYSGTSGHLAFLIFRAIFPLFGFGWIRNMLVSGATNKEIQQEMHKHTGLLASMAWFADNIGYRYGCVLAGVPYRQAMLGYHRDNFLYVLSRVFLESDLVNDNYFFAGYILGYYTEKNCPRYLRPENFSNLRAQLRQNKLRLYHGDILSAIRDSEKTITVASLLDHMDWMSEEMVHDEITTLISKMDPINGRIYWRSFADWDQGVHSAPLLWLNPHRVDDHDDRVCMYFSTWVSRLNEINYAPQPLNNEKLTGCIINQLLTGVVITTFPIWHAVTSRFASASEKTNHGDAMESFYKMQKDGYDAFRENMLHARSGLVCSVPLKKTQKMVWVDVGGGTARNLQYFTPEAIRAHFSKIVIVDVSTSLLEVAKQRIAAMGLGDIVTVLEHDFTAETVFRYLPPQNSVDLVTMSYSLSMIPKKEMALAHASRLSKPSGEGVVAIADFFAHGNYDSSLPVLSSALRWIERDFHRKWFACDGVFLLEDRMVMNAHKHGLAGIWDKRFRGPVPFLPFLVPYHGVMMFTKSTH